MKKEDADKILKDDFTFSIWGVIRLITEADYGCEELSEGTAVKDRVVIVTREGEQIVEVEDQILLNQKLDEGSEIPYTLKSLFIS